MSETGILGVKSWRQKQGISLETIAAATKLSVRQLSAIESGDFTKLPGGIYNTSYIKQYAKAIGFDEVELLAFYQNQLSNGKPRAAEQRPHSRISGPAFQN